MSERGQEKKPTTESAEEGRLLESERNAVLLDNVQAPVESSSVTLTSGRQYELHAGEHQDSLTIRSRGGDIVLSIQVTDQGPVLSFRGASLDLVASRQLRLEADEITVKANKDMRLDAGGSLSEAIGGDHHTLVEGQERLEANAVEMQANVGAVQIRAMRKIALDGEHIGLNDDPLPQPFPWSTLRDET